MGLFDNIFKKKGIPEKMTFLGKGIEINPEALIFSKRGLDKYQADDYQGSIADFSLAINAQPKNQNFYAMRGTAYEDIGNDIEAEKDFKRALEINDTHFVAAFRLGMLCFLKKDFENAIKWLKVSYENCPDENSKLEIGYNNYFISKKVIAGNLGDILRQVKRFDEGLKYLEEAIRIAPTYFNPYYAKGIAYAEMGKLQEGILFVKKAADLADPQKEMQIRKVLKQLVEQAKNGDEKEKLELDFVFHSPDHLRYENRRHVSGPHGGAPRAIKVEANVSGDEGYTVTIFNTDGEQSVVQMAPKQMKLESFENEKIQLKGYGRDQMGASFADYGLTIYYDNGQIVKCIMHMYDRNVDIEYQP